MVDGTIPSYFRFFLPAFAPHGTFHDRAVADLVILALFLVWWRAVALVRARAADRRSVTADLAGTGANR